MKKIILVIITFFSITTFMFSQGKEEEQLETEDTYQIEPGPRPGLELIQQRPPEQKHEWQGVRLIKEYFDLFDIEADVWFNESNRSLNFEDANSKNFDEINIRYILPNIMTAFMFMLEDNDQTFKSMGLSSITYTYFQILDPNVSKYDPPNLRYDFYMNKQWTIEYLNATRNEKEFMLKKLYSLYHEYWLPSKSY